ncbi:RDD family protein [Novosphingobium sp.]|uniref:RDD family protein n=1 Tax=Novosphingobium sp. TaxID=1874826 RepID=UPI00261E021D|nr:RDD family protein [Novosphingobium sp.]
MEQALEAAHQDAACDHGDVARAASPWQRYWARQVDLTLAGWVAWLALRVVLPSAAGFGGDSLWAFWRTIALLPVVFVIDAVILAWWGRTPGLWLCGLRVVTVAGAPLGLAKALRRNLLVYVYGFGLGLPLISLVTCIHNHNKVEQNKPTSWDVACGTRVDDAEGSTLRTWSTFGLLVALSLPDALFTIDW